MTGVRDARAIDVDKLEYSNDTLVQCYLRENEAEGKETALHHPLSR
jgi:hypothetical protein